MRERPILFSAPMVRAILADTKTQTRRAMKFQVGESGIVRMAGPGYCEIVNEHGVTIPGWHCPYGQPGDRLWVKETFRFTKDFDADSPFRVAERCLDAGYRLPWAPVQYEADGARSNWQHTSTPPHDGPPLPGKTRVSIHMPRWASRITLEITGVRVQRLQDISETDARSEGVTIEERHTTGYCAGEYLPPAIRAFRDLWTSINGAGSWAANPWVWVMEFKRIDARQQQKPAKEDAP